MIIINYQACIRVISTKKTDVCDLIFILTHFSYLKPIFLQDYA